MKLVSLAFPLCAMITAACAPLAEWSRGDEEAPPASTYANDTSRGAGFAVDPSFVPVRAPVELRRSALRREGEVLVLEGDSRFVSTNGVGFGITDDNTAQIIQEVLANYPDEFDTIQIFLSFLDEAHAGTAYYQPIKNTVQGIGVTAFDSRGTYGLGPDGRLTGFVNMNQMDMWGDLPQLTIPRGFFYSVIAQELSHRWLMQLLFKDASGQTSDVFLGRQRAHWAAYVHAYGSCQDGVFWQDNGDGTFTHMGESDRGWAPADKYAMGIIGKEQVEPLFYMVEATYNGQPVERESHSDLSRGAKVSGRKVTVRIDDIIAALGPRNPPVHTESPYYRAATVLVTKPGQAEAEWRPYLEAVQEVGRTFPETWKEWSGGYGALCMKVTERCPEPLLGLERATISDGNDGYLAPGEPFELEIALRNDGVGKTENVQVVLTAAAPGVEVRSSTIALPAIGEREVQTVPQRFQLAIGADVPCGSVVQLIEQATTAQGPKFAAPLELPVGTKRLKFDPLDEAPDWTVNPDGTDDATAGPWALGAPEFISVIGVVTQPAEDHTPGESKLAFMTGPRKGQLFSSNDVDGGKTTLESPVYALGATRDPTLVFYYWHVAENLAHMGGPVPVDGAELLVSASNDGGGTWVELGKLSDDTKAWTRASFRLKDKLQPTNRTRFRFEVADHSTPGTVEAGIDDLEIIDYLDSCVLPGDHPDAGVGPATGKRDEGCSVVGEVARGGGPRGLVMVLGLGLLFGLRRRSRRSTEARPPVAPAPVPDLRA